LQEFYYSYFHPPCVSFQFIESITIESFYKHSDSMLVNQPLKIYSNPDSINISATYILDTLILKRGFEFFYRIQAKDKGIIPHYSYKPDTGYYKVVLGNLTNVEDKRPNFQLTEFALSQNYPNPFNPETNISYQLPVSSKVSLKVYDVLGNEVATLVNEEKPAGKYQVNFNTQHTTNNQQLSSGVYFYRLQAGNFVQTKKFILMK